MQDRPRGQLGAAVADDHERPAAMDDERLELAARRLRPSAEHHRAAGLCRSSDLRQSLQCSATVFGRLDDWKNRRKR
jgi:hypothetical protein